VRGGVGGNMSRAMARMGRGVVIMTKAVLR